MKWKTDPVTIADASEAYDREKKEAIRNRHSHRVTHWKIAKRYGINVSCLWNFRRGVRTMITQKQVWLYWREWREAKRVLMNGSGARRSPRVLGKKIEPIITGGGDDCAFDEKTRRHELHRRALGYDKSHKDFNNRELDLVLGEFRAISRPADLQSQLHALDGRKARLIFGIRRAVKKLGVDDRYINAVIARMTDRTAELDQLNEDELENVRIAIAKQVVRENKREVAA